MEPNEQNKLMNKIERRGMDTWNRKTAVVGEVGRGDWVKYSEGIKQMHTYTHISICYIDIHIYSVSRKCQVI